MKRSNDKLMLKLIGIGVVLAFILSLFRAEYAEAFRDGYNEGYNSPHNVYKEKLILSKKDTTAEGRIILVSDGVSIQLKDIESKYYAVSPQKLWSYPFYMYFIFIFALIISILLLIYFLRFVRNLLAGEVLSRNTYRSLLYLGFCAIVFSILDYMYSYVEWHELSKTFEHSEFIVKKNFVFSFSWLIGGLIFMALAIGIKLGVQVKEENELTV